MPRLKLKKFSNRRRANPRRYKSEPSMESPRATGSFNKNVTRSDGLPFQYGDSLTDRDGLDVPLPSGEQQDDSRNAKTAPSTPEAESRLFPRHAESTSQLEMSGHGKKHHKHSPDGHSGQKSPHKEVSPKMNKSRNEKFHKLFKNIPDDEVVLNAYSCAYFGDILLQGNLYISPNWFCFHSKILGHEKLIEIHVTKVVNVTREKTAFIIPNAIGIRTAEDKFVFGSLMSRDNTYKLMVNVWKQGRTQLGMLGADTKDLNDEDTSDINPSLECDEEYSAENNNLVLKQSQALEVTEESSESDTSMCDRCGKLKSDQCLQGCLRARFVPSAPKPNSVSSLDEMTKEKKTKDYIPFSIFYRPVSAASKIVSNITGMPRTSLLLIICGLLVLLLMLSAAVMTYKIMVLQAKIEGSTPWSDPKAPVSGCTAR